MAERGRSATDSSPQAPNLEECRWGWCRLAFSTHAELERHVIDEHVLVAKPINFSQVSAFARAEDGLGDSLHVSQLIDSDAESPQQSWRQHTEASRSQGYGELRI
jgi:hypothetical protein